MRRLIASPDKVVRKAASSALYGLDRAAPQRPCAPGRNVPRFGGPGIAPGPLRRTHHISPDAAIRVLPELRTYSEREITELGLTNQTPTLTFPGAADKCKPGGYHGENAKEFYFDVEVDNALKEPPTARFACDGVEVACVRVGHTKVAFEKADGGVTFPLVFDTSNPYTLHMENRAVPEVLLYGMHKPRDRASGPAFRDVPWQAAAVAAEWNLLYGCLEVFRDMKIGDAATRDFDGYVAIGGYETTYPRIGRGPGGHSEGTAHIHLFLVVPPGWRIRQASHLYIGSDGRFTGKTHCGPSGCDDPSREYPQGTLCAQKDFKDRMAYEFRIEADGALMIRRREGAEEYRVRPDATTRSFTPGCEIVKADKPLCRVVVSDDCEKGEMRIVRTILGGTAPESHEEVIRYDPDTSAVLSRTQR